MTALALRSAGDVNAVSRLHGEVTRDMWGADVARRRRTERPVSPVTNGVHVPTWMAGEIADLFTRYLGADWRERHDDPALWDGVLAIPDDELWAVRQSLRQYLFTFIRERARQRWTDEHVSTPRVVAAGTLLDPDALTIGFARRFAGYKRPELVFTTPIGSRGSSTPRGGRCRSSSPASRIRPTTSASTICSACTGARSIPLFGGRVAFVDDYDLHVAHFLVQGCDVWLNTPRKPLEASGTSGMKAAINGVPHLSIGDGWWAEGVDRRATAG